MTALHSVVLPLSADPDIGFINMPIEAEAAAAPSSKSLQSIRRLFWQPRHKIREKDKQS